ncbi:unnamed protein product [Nezara viridula]|uniref:Alpha 1,4-glycosyltransferase domain-containing protein n=1 Tax=Nezara viridula TaxID=85310 RepID=A0A9P0MY77_NEZVI|nr:unnamed protein product [Nezara viridula]
MFKTTSDFYSAMNRSCFTHLKSKGLSSVKKWLVLILFLVAVSLAAYYYTVQLEQSRKLAIIERPIIGNKERKARTTYAVPFIFRPITPSPFNVFFVETSCAFQSSVKPGFLQLSKRQACAIYSTAVLNPKHRIIIVHTCPLIKDYSQRWKEDWPELLSLGNVGVVEAKIPWLLSETPVASLLDGRLNRSAYPVEHTSDLVRFAVLYKYGGTYLDTDIISIRPLDDLGHNYIGAQEDKVLASGIMNINPTDVGHQFIEEALSALKFSFNGSVWAANGPQLITRQLRKFCKLDPKETFDKMGKLDCGLTVHPPNTFYPIPYWEWEEFFDETAWPRIKDQLNNTYILHFWNKLTKDSVIYVGSQQPYGIIAANYCSPIYYKNGDEF